MQELKKIVNVYEALDATTILAVTDTKGCILYANQNFCDISKYSKDELLGKTHRIINSGYHDASFFKNMWEVISQGTTWRGEICNQAKDGTVYWVDTTIVPSKNELGEVEQYIAIRSDITEKKMLAFKLEEQLVHDSITGLPNSIYLESIVTKKIAANEPFYLLKINIDDFKSLNESIGMEHANQILKKISERLKAISQHHHVLLTRAYGDEFILLCPMSKEQIKSFIHTLRKLCDTPIHYLDSEHYMTFCIGGVRYPEDTTSYQDLVYYISTAIDYAKKKGKNTYAFFKHTMLEDIDENLALKNKLFRAIQTKAFTMHYQPQWNAHHEIIGFESLARWYDETHGFISPAKFIPLAERTGLIIPLSYLLFEQMLQDFLRLQNVMSKQIKIAFNLSIRQFFDEQLVSRLLQLCEKYNIQSSCIKIEITEGISAFSVENVIPIIQKLYDSGMEVEIDDYGTGFSNFKYLKDLPIHGMKIDQTFIATCMTSVKRKAIVNSMIHLAHELGFSIIAEGIEDEQQLQYLTAQGCDIFQGYLLGRPQPVNYYEK